MTLSLRLLLGWMILLLVVSARGETVDVGAVGMPLFKPLGPGQFTVERDRAALEWLGDDEILRVTVHAPRPRRDSDVQLRSPLPAGVRAGEVVFLRFKVRCLYTGDESGVGQISPVVEMRGEPFAKILWVRCPVSAEWQEVIVPARARRDFEDGTLSMNFRVGHSPQVLEIKDLELWKLPEATDIDALPSTPPPSYAGREADAPWRAEAERRIREHRMQDLRVRVLDAAGRPVPGAQVRLEQTRHAFGFGTAISMSEILGGGDPANIAMYRSVLLGAFDSCGTENDLKWQPWERHRERTLAGLEWLSKQGFRDIRGHVLLWPSFQARRTPDYLPQYASDPEKLRAVIMEHLADIIIPTAPYVQEWDVINEPRTSRDILDLLGGDTFMVEVFEEARRLLPEGRLFLNEALTFTPDHRVDTLEETARHLLEAGAPLDGIGIQCHYNGWMVTAPEQIWETLDRLAALGLSIRVTEFDLDTMDEAFHADYVRDFYTAVFSHPSVTGIQMWGFWAGRHWKPSAALWRENWEITPAGRAYLNLVRGQWWTQVSGRSDAVGTWSARGFKGDYRITVTRDEQVLALSRFSLGDEVLELEVRLDE